MPVLIGIVVLSVLVRADNEVVSLAVLCIAASWGFIKMMGGYH